MTVAKWLMPQLNTPRLKLFQIESNVLISFNVFVYLIFTFRHMIHFYQTTQLVSCFDKTVLYKSWWTYDLVDDFIMRAVILLPVLLVLCSGNVLKNEERELDWWETTIFYQIYPRSFADSNGDGIGDLNGRCSNTFYETWFWPIHFFFIKMMLKLYF